MDESTVGILGFFILISTLFGGAMYYNQQGGIRRLQCIQAIHDKPAAEIKVVCG